MSFYKQLACRNTVSKVFSIVATLGSTLKKAIWPTPLNELDFSELVTLASSNFLDKEIHAHLYRSLVVSETGYPITQNTYHFISHQAYGTYTVTKHPTKNIGYVESFFDETPYLFIYCNMDALKEKFPHHNILKSKGDNVLNFANQSKAGIIIQNALDLTVAIIEPDIIPSLSQRLFISDIEKDTLYRNICSNNKDDVASFFNQYPSLIYYIKATLKIEGASIPQQIMFVPLYESIISEAIDVLTYFIEELYISPNTLNSEIVHLDKNFSKNIPRYDLYTLLDFAKYHHKKNAEAYLLSKKGMTFNDYDRATSSYF